LIFEIKYYIIKKQNAWKVGLFSMNSLPIRLAIQSIYSTLNPNDQKIADYIIDNPNQVIDSTITEVALAIGVADSTFYQFTRKLGFKGYKDFKIALIKEHADTLSTQQNSANNTNPLQSGLVNSLFSKAIQSITDTQSALSDAKLSLTSEALQSCSDFYIVSSDRMNNIATYCYSLFLSTNLNPRYTPSTFLQKKLLTQLKQNDCIFVFSSFFDTEHMKETIKSIKDSGAYVISFSDTYDSEMENKSNIAFSSFSTSMNKEKTDFAVSVSLLCMLEAIYGKFKANK
jgi:DNA-binding MurR/RpiR family transcriptional regulator